MSGIINNNWVNNGAQLLRTPETEGCIFPGCHQKDIGQVPNLLKVNFLCKMNFLISSETQVCRHHCLAGEEEWAPIIALPSNCTDFNASHAENIIDLLRFSLDMVKSVVETMSCDVLERVRL
jgi:hypothetical protein